MEGEVGSRRGFGRRANWVVILFLWFYSGVALAQEVVSGEATKIELHKSVQSREYQGRAVEGEERLVHRGDSLWRILVQEKGLSEKRFRSYLVIIRGLNPQIKNLDILQIGDSIFIPLRPDEVLGVQTAAVKPEASIPPRTLTQSAPTPSNTVPAGNTSDYRVKAGDSLYTILRKHLETENNKVLMEQYAVVRELNQAKQNWDLLREGEIIRLPKIAKSPQATLVEIKTAVTAAPAESKAVATATPRASAPLPSKDEPLPDPVPGGIAVDRYDPRQLPLQENFSVLEKVLAALGNQLQIDGEESVVLKEGTVRIDRSAYPVVYSPKLGQKVVIDRDGQIPASLKTKLTDPSVGAPVFTMGKGLSLQEAVSRLLTSLGYQKMPAGQSVVIQEQGIAYEVKGAWTLLAPEESHKIQEIYVINLSPAGGEIPQYLKSHLAQKGIHLKDIVLPSTDSLRPVAASNAIEYVSQAKIRTWPRDKRDLVDAFLLAYGISFGVAETLAVNLGDGLRVDIRSDRVLDLNGKSVALFFQRTEPAIRNFLQQKQGVKTVELDLASLPSREIIGKLLKELGDEAVYREHRLAAPDGSKGDRLVVATSGFLLSKRSLFVTDRKIPPNLHRFFFERGLEIVYFE